MVNNENNNDLLTGHHRVTEDIKVTLWKSADKLRAQNQSAQDVMGEAVLVEMAREVAKKLRENLTVDWAVRDSVRARLRILIRTLLRKYKYPPDQQPGAVDTVLRQAEVISEDLAA